jgi:hypothetical protein
MSVSWRKFYIQVGSPLISLLEINGTTMIEAYLVVLNMLKSSCDAISG